MGQCPNCGAAAKPEETTCAACGTTLAAAVAGATGVAAARPAQPASGAPPAERTAASDRSKAAPSRHAAAPPRSSAQEGAPTDMGPQSGFRSPEQRARELGAPARQAPSAGARAPREVTGPPRARPSPVRAAMPALVALVVSLVMQWLINSMVPADAYVFRLFRPAGGWIMSVVPALIVFVFVWTITDLFLKYRVGRGNERDLRRPEIQQLPALVAQEPTSVTLQRLRGWDQRMMLRPGGRRIVWLLRHLNANADTQRMHELLRHQSDLDVDAAASGYRTAKLFIWAMPILGFIGTVLGISLAVGGFSDFLTTSVSIDEIDRVTAELGEVASGLSFAFDTTLLGLLAGLVASVASSGVQEREERFVTGLDELGLRIMENSESPTTPRPAPAVAGAAHPTPEFNQAMQARLEELVGQMDRFTRGSDELITRTQQLMAGLHDSSSRVGSGLASSIGSVTKTVEELGGRLHGVSDTLARSVGGLNDRVAASEGAVQAGLAQLQETIEGNHRASATAIASMHEANQQLVAALASSAEQVSQASARLHAGVQSQAATEQAMHTLSASIAQLSERLTEFRAAQDALAPVLTQLAGPLELRLMATPPGQGGGAGRGG